MHTIVIDMFVNHFNPKYETQFSQCLQVVGMNDVRTKEVVQKSAQLIHIVTAKIKLSRLLTTTTKGIYITYKRKGDWRLKNWWYSCHSSWQMRKMNVQEQRDKAQWSRR